MIELSTSDKANPNYLAKVVRLMHLRKHSNADKLQCVMLDGNNVIVGIDQKEGDLGVVFPLESQLSDWFLKQNNLYRDKTLNEDQTKAGFFELNGRIRALKLRGEKSEGFWVPAHNLGVSEHDLEKFLNKEFDTVNGQLLVKKYVIPSRMVSQKQGEPGSKKDIVKKQDLLVPGQFSFHIDTPQLGKNVWKLKPEHHITITQKLHGTSFICSKVLVKRKLSWKDKVAKFFGVSVVETEYKNLYASRRVIKNLGSQNPGFYGNEDIWGLVNERIAPCLSDSMTIYGEAVGYLPSGKWIQKGYDYGCKPGEYKIWVYRITSTTPSGKVLEWSWQQVKSFCELAGLNYVPELWSGKAEEILPATELHWHDNLLQKLKDTYLEKDCWLCTNKVPDEGIVVRVDNSLDFDVYKLKSFRFFEHESKMLDSGEVDVESEESQMMEV